MIYEEDLEEELPKISDKPLQEIIEEEEEEEAEEDEEEEEEEEVEVEPEVPPPDTTKKVRIGGFFGKEITITTKKVQKKQISETPKIKEEEKDSVSITSLKPPRKRGGAKTISLCQICGATIRSMKICPTCGAKVM